MNLSDAVSVKIGGKLVQSICIDGREVYSAGYNIRVSADKSYILTGETATVTVSCEDLPNTDIQVFKVINMTRTLWKTLTTDENGVASDTYTGAGVGEIGFVAVYDDKDSNTVVIDDYVPEVDTVGLSISSSTVSYGTSVTLTATVKDQHNQNITSGTVTFKDGETTIGTGTVTDGAATLTISTLNVGSHSITAEISDKTSNLVVLAVNKIATSITISSGDVAYPNNPTISGVLDVGSGKSVKIYKNGTLFYTTTTGSDGAYSYTPSSRIYMPVGEYTFKAVYEGDSTHEACESSTVTIHITKGTLTLAIDVPQLVYEDEFSITGTLSAALNNAPIILVWNDGTEHTVTGYTNNQGKVTFSRSAPTSITDYSFQLVYEGSDNFYACSSSVENRTVGKETSVLTVTSPASYGYVLPTVHVIGTLKENEGTPMANKTIKVSTYFMWTKTLITSGTTDSNGAFDIQISASSISSDQNSDRNIVVEYDGDDYYTSSSTGKIRVNKVDGIGLTSTKDTLSYAGGDTCTLTAQLKKGSSSATLSGATVTFKVYDSTETTLLETLTSGETDSSGQATTTFTSKGYGDIKIKAECDLLIQTYSIEDCLKVINGGTDTRSNTTHTANTLADTNGIGNCSIESTLKSTGNGFRLDFSKTNDSVSVTSDFISCGVTGGGAKHCSVDSTNYYTSPQQSYTLNSDMECKITVEGTTVKLYIDDELYTTQTYTASQLRYIRLQSWNTAKTITYTTIKIKPL